MKVFELGIGIGIGIGMTNESSIGIGKNNTDPPSLMETSISIRFDRGVCFGSD